MISQPIHMLRLVPTIESSSDDLIGLDCPWFLEPDDRMTSYRRLLEYQVYVILDILSFAITGDMNITTHYELVIFSEYRLKFINTSVRLLKCLFYLIALLVMSMMGNVLMSQILDFSADVIKSIDVS